MRFFTSEQVSCGHPDKVCDRIADTLLDAYCAGDPASRVAIEVLMKNDLIVLAGEVTSQAQIDVPAVVQTALDYVGLKEQYTIQNHIFKQSPDIALGVDVGGAGDQGIMFGFACDETEECLPLAYMLATKALKKVRALHHPLLGADAKTLVKNGVKYVGEGANMPSDLEAINIFQTNGIAFAPAKAANAGGVATSALEMSQNSMRLAWTFEEVDARLKGIMQNIYKNISDAAERYGVPGDYVAGANIAGFEKVANAMLAQGAV